MSFNIVRLKWCMPRDTKEFLECWNIRGETRSRNGDTLIPACICWFVRWERYARCFEDKENSIKKIKEQFTFIWFFGVNRISLVKLKK